MCNTDLLKLHLYLKTKKHKNIENNKTFSFSSNPQELESLNSLSDWLSLGSEVIVFVVIMRLHGDATPEIMQKKPIHLNIQIEQSNTPTDIMLCNTHMALLASYLA